MSTVVSCREIHRLSGEVDSHVMQAAVLLETIETLQSGASNEQEQRLVALTAQLASAQKQAAAQEARIRGLLVSCMACIADGASLYYTVASAAVSIRPSWICW